MVVRVSRAKAHIPYMRGEKDRLLNLVHQRSTAAESCSGLVVFCIGWNAVRGLYRKTSFVFFGRGDAVREQENESELDRAFFHRIGWKQALCNRWM